MSKPSLDVFQNVSKSVVTRAGNRKEKRQAKFVLFTTSGARFLGRLELQRKANATGFSLQELIAINNGSLSKMSSDGTADSESCIFTDEDYDQYLLMAVALLLHTHCRSLGLQSRSNFEKHYLTSSFRQKWPVRHGTMRSVLRTGWSSQNQNYRLKKLSAR